MKNYGEKYILLIVTIVAAVGIGVMLFSDGIVASEVSDVTGMAYKGGPTCGDGVCQSYENPKKCPSDCKRTRDTDGDGLPDAKEVKLGTDPTVADTDGDGYSDGEEVSAGTDPLDANNYPLPDLVVDESQSTVWIEGTVDLYDGVVTNIGSGSITMTLGINNQGNAAAVGDLYNEVLLYFPADGTFTNGVASASGATTFNLNPGATTTHNVVDNTISVSQIGDLLQEIYDTGETDVDFKYEIDYSVREYIVESDETNNDGYFPVHIDSSMYNLTFVCYELTTVGDSTYYIEVTC